MKTTRRSHDDRISNEQLRRHFEGTTITAYELGERLGILRTYRTRSKRDGTVTSERRAGDHTAVLRDLGIKSHPSGDGRHYHRRTISVEKARRYAEALGLIPAEVGL